MRIDFRKTALVTMVTVVLAQVCGIYITLSANPVHSWTAYVLFAIGVLLVIPFPILLFVLYKTGTVPAVSGKLRTIAIVITLIYSTHFLANTLYVLFQIDSLEYFKFAVRIVLEIVCIIFLVALCLQKQGAPSANKLQAKLVWNMALVTLFATWGGAALKAVHAGVSMANDERAITTNILAARPEHWVFYLQHTGEIVSLLCWAIAAWILYMGLSSANEPFLKTGN